MPGPRPAPRRPRRRRRRAARHDPAAARRRGTDAVRSGAARGAGARLHPPEPASRSPRSTGFPTCGAAACWSWPSAATTTRTHAQQIVRLALALFDQTRAIHGLTDREREWLEYAALLHDIGVAHQLRAPPPALVLPDQERRPARVRSGRDRGHRAGRALPPPRRCRSKSHEEYARLPATAAQDGARRSRRFCAWRRASTAATRRRSRGSSCATAATTCRCGHGVGRRANWRCGPPAATSHRSKSWSDKPVRLEVARLQAAAAQPAGAPRPAARPTEHRRPDARIASDGVAATHAGYIEFTYAETGREILAGRWLVVSVPSPRRHGRAAPAAVPGRPAPRPGSHAGEAERSGQDRGGAA